MKTSKKILGVLLALVMVLSLVPMAFAEGEEEIVPATEEEVLLGSESETEALLCCPPAVEPGDTVEPADTSRDFCEILSYLRTLAECAANMSDCDQARLMCGLLGTPDDYAALLEMDGEELLALAETAGEEMAYIAENIAEKTGDEITHLFDGMTCPPILGLLDDDLTDMIGHIDSIISDMINNCGHHDCEHGTQPGEGEHGDHSGHGGHGGHGDKDHKHRHDHDKKDDPETVVSTVTVLNSFAEVTGEGEYKCNDAVRIDAGTREGFEFIGWLNCSQNDVAELDDFFSAVANFQIPASGSHHYTLLACWLPTGEIDVDYTLTFVTNGGSSVDPVIGNVDDGPIDLSKHVTTRDGYTFLGWYADEELTQPISTVILDKDYTVYAKWQANAVATGDNFSIGLWVAVATVSGLCAAAFVLNKKFRKA